MALVSITRLRVRSRRYVPLFFIQSFRAAMQAKRARGNISVSLLRDAHNAFWTKTLWTDEQAMREYMMAGMHRRVMPSLLEWCDEAALVSWVQAAADPPSWEEAHQKIQQHGRRSKVNHPSKDHVAYRIPQPVRLKGEGRIK
jgi:hypothetical protein